MNTFMSYWYWRKGLQKQFVFGSGFDLKVQMDVLFKYVLCKTGVNSLLLLLLLLQADVSLTFPEGSAPEGVKENQYAKKPEIVVSGRKCLHHVIILGLSSWYYLLKSIEAVQNGGVLSKVVIPGPGCYICLTSNTWIKWLSSAVICRRSVFFFYP